VSTTTTMARIGGLGATALAGAAVDAEVTAMGIGAGEERGMASRVASRGILILPSPRLQQQQSPGLSSKRGYVQLRTTDACKKTKGRTLEPNAGITKYTTKSSETRSML
jgi:hypothetical protein